MKAPLLAVAALGGCAQRTPPVAGADSPEAALRAFFAADADRDHAAVEAVLITPARFAAAAACAPGAGDVAYVAHTRDGLAGDPLGEEITIDHVTATVTELPAGAAWHGCTTRVPIGSARISAELHGGRADDPVRGGFVYGGLRLAGRWYVLPE